MRPVGFGYNWVCSVGFDYHLGQVREGCRVRATGLGEVVSGLEPWARWLEPPGDSAVAETEKERESERAAFTPRRSS